MFLDSLLMWIEGLQSFVSQYKTLILQLQKMGDITKLGLPHFGNDFELFFQKSTTLYSFETSSAISAYLENSSFSAAKVDSGKPTNLLMQCIQALFFEEYVAKTIELPWTLSLKYSLDLHSNFLCKSVRQVWYMLWHISSTSALAVGFTTTCTFG